MYGVYGIRRTALITRAVCKASKLHVIFPNAPASQFEVIELPSLVSDYTEAVKGISALIHSASPGYIAGDSKPQAAKSGRARNPSNSTYLSCVLELADLANFSIHLATASNSSSWFLVLLAL
jgi:hypothetical protein